MNTYLTESVFSAADSLYCT